MKVKVKKRITVDDVVDVVFPLYVKTWDSYESGNSWEMIMRIDSNGDTWSITENDNGRGKREYEFDAGRIVLERELAQWLESDCWTLPSDKEFIAMVERAVAVLASFPIKPEAVTP
jgi:hypothetical protein